MQDAHLSLVPPNVVLSCRLRRLLGWAGVSVGGTGRKKPPLLVLTFPLRGPLPRAKIWTRTRGPRLLRALLRAHTHTCLCTHAPPDTHLCAFPGKGIPFQIDSNFISFRKPTRQCGLGMGVERGQLGRVSHPGTPDTQVTAPLSCPSEPLFHTCDTS